MSTAIRRLTYQQWLDLPESMERCEIVDGATYMPPGPDADHQWILQEVFLHCREFSRDSQVGVFMAAPLDLVIQREPLRVRQPDIMFLNAARTGIRGRGDLQGISPLEVSPDITIEILSPSNTRREMEGRLRDYKHVGVIQCWLFSPQAETAEILDLTGDEPRTVALFGAGDILRSDLLPGFELGLADVFS